MPVPCSGERTLLQPVSLYIYVSMPMSATQQSSSCDKTVATNRITSRFNELRKFFASCFYPQLEAQAQVSSPGFGLPPFWDSQWESHTCQKYSTAFPCSVVSWIACAHTGRRVSNRSVEGEVWSCYRCSHWVRFGSKDGKIYLAAV